MAREFLIDFGTNSVPTNYTGVYVGQSSNVAVITSTGDASTLRVTYGGPINNNGGSIGTTANTTYHANATYDAVYISTGTTATITIAGLQTDGRTYSFTFFASRTSVADVRTAKYTIGATSVVLDASNNVSNVVTISDVEPDESGQVVITFEPDAATNTNASQLSYLSLIHIIEGDGPAIPLAAASLTRTGHTATQVQFSRGDASGGEGSYTYHLHRFARSDATPSVGTRIATVTGATFSDTPPVAGTPYAYRLESNDGTNAAYSAVVWGGVKAATTPLPLPYQPGPIVIAFMGSSTYQIVYAPSLQAVPEMADTALEAEFGREVTTINSGVYAAGTVNFAPGQSASNTLKSAMQAATGYKVLRIMLASNDAAAELDPAVWVSRIQAIVDDAKTWPVDAVIIEETGARFLPEGVENRILNFNDVMPNITGVYLGTARTFLNQILDNTVNAGDQTHQTLEGAQNLAAEQNHEVRGLFFGPPTIAAGTPTTSTIPITGNAATGGSGTLTYTIQTSPAGAGTWTDNAGAYSEGGEATGLTPGTSYDVRVKVEDGVNAAVYSNTVTAGTASERRANHPGARNALGFGFGF